MSNKMPEKPVSETKSEPKRKNPLGFWLGSGLIFFGLLAVISGIIGLTDSRQRLFAPQGAITVEIVNTSEKRQLGLSGRESIGDDEGMLFVFDEVDKHCFWMKDMNFPIDMIWIDENKQVINVWEFVEPDTYPDSFCAEKPAKYGLEIQGYKSLELGIEQGIQLRF